MQTLKYFTMLLFVLMVAATTTAQAGKAKKGHKIDVTIHGLADSTVFLAHYEGSRMYYSDTAQIDSKGNFTFSGDEPLNVGIYAIVYSGMKLFEFIVNEQQLRFETNSSAYMKDLKMINSVENQVFYDWQMLKARNANKAIEIQAKLDTLMVGEDSVRFFNTQLMVLDRAVNDHIATIYRDHPDLFVTVLIKALDGVGVPEIPTLPNGKKDSTFTYRYTKEHFFDHIDLSDSRLIACPVLSNRVSYYLSSLTVQHPDSIIESLDKVIKLTNGNYDTFKYIVSYFANKYERSNRMGNDAIFVHMVDTYYSTGLVDWVEKEQIEKIVSRANEMRPMLIGNLVTDLNLKNAMGKYMSIYDVKAKFTILWFWDPDCGHCKEATPQLVELMKDYDSKDVQVYAIGIMKEKEPWLKFIEEKKMTWINVEDTDLKSNLRHYYDLKSTPLLILLDDKKKIVAKKVKIETLGEILKQVMEL